MLNCKVLRSVYLAGGADGCHGRITTTAVGPLFAQPTAGARCEPTFFAENLSTPTARGKVSTEHPTGRGRQLQAWLQFLFSYNLPRLSRPNDSSAVFASPLVLFRHYISNPLVRC